MSFWNLSKYIFNALIKTFGFWVCLIIYLFVVSIMNFIIPKILKISLFELYNHYRFLIIVLVFVIVFLASYVAIFLFKKGFDNGEELIWQAKPITRSTIIWAKLFILFVFATLSSTITFILNIFVLITENNPFIIHSILLGSFLGTFINFLFWSGIAIFIASFFNKLVVFGLVFAIVFGLQIVSTIIGAKTKSNGKIIRDEYQIEYEPLWMYTTTNDVVHWDRQEYVVMTGKNGFINKNSLIGNKPITEITSNLHEFARTFYDNVAKQNNLAIKNYLDINNLLTSQYYWFNGYSSVNPLEISESLLSDAINYSYYMNFIDQKIDFQNNVNFQNKLFLITHMHGNFEDYGDDLVILSNNNSKQVLLPHYDLAQNKITKIPITSLQHFNQTFYNDAQIQLAKKLSFISPKFSTYYNWINSSYFITHNNSNINKLVENYPLRIPMYLINSVFYYQTFNLIQDYLNNVQKEQYHYLDQYYSDVKAQTIEAWFNLFDKKVVVSEQLGTNGKKYYWVDNIDSLIGLKPDKQSFIFLKTNYVEHFFSLLNQSSSPKSVLNDQQLDMLLFYKFNFLSNFEMIHIDDLITTSVVSVHNYYENSIVIFVVFLLFTIFIILLSSNLIYAKDIS